MASSITQAREGTLYLMIGGKEEVFNSSRICSMTSHPSFVGESGKAAQVKALVNMVMNINTGPWLKAGHCRRPWARPQYDLRNLSQTGANSRVLETDSEDMIDRSRVLFLRRTCRQDSGIAIAVKELESMFPWPKLPFPNIKKWSMLGWAIWINRESLN